MCYSLKYSTDSAGQNFLSFHEILWVCRSGNTPQLDPNITRFSPKHPFSPHSSNFKY